MKSNYYRIIKMLMLGTFVIPPYLLTGQDKIPDFKKGSWHTGLTMSITDVNNENIDYLLLEMPNFENAGFSINFLGGYFFADRISSGLRYNYSQREIDFVYDWNEDNSRLQSAYSKHHFIVFLRNYYPLGTNKRFSFFNETDLGIGFGNNLLRHTKSETDVSKSFSEKFTLEFGVKPGISAVLTKGFAFEVAVGLLGLTYSDTDIIREGVEEGHKRKFKFDFDVSLLTLDFGLAYYF